MSTMSAMKYNLGAYPATSRDESAAAIGAVTGAAANVGAMSPDNPAVWLLGIGAVTIGLVAFSTHFRGEISVSR